MAAKPVEVYLEVTNKKVFASAVEWPGWSRSGRDEEAALDALASYAARYAPVVARVGLKLPARASEHLSVVERVDGDASTEFGALGPPIALDATFTVNAKEAARLAAIVEAAWAALDDTAASAPPELRKGPRGGGRDRDAILQHVLDAEAGYVRWIGLKLTAPPWSDRPGVADFRTTISTTIREVAKRPFVGIRRDGATWPPRYAARRLAWHALDHAWEIEDRH